MKKSDMSTNNTVEQEADNWENKSVMNELENYDEMSVSDIKAPYESCMFLSLDVDVVEYVLRKIKAMDVFSALTCKRFYEALTSTVVQGVPCILTSAFMAYKFVTKCNTGGLEVILSCLKNKHYFYFPTRCRNPQGPLLNFACVYDKQGDCLKMLMKYGAFELVNSRSVVTDIVANNNHVGLQIVIDNGLKINFYNPNNHLANPLIYAIACGSVKCVEVLITNGAETRRKYTCGRTPFHYLSCLTPQKSIESIIDMLLSSGANINSRDIYGVCPLKNAITDDLKIGVVKALVNAKANVNNVKLGAYRTPIVCAIERHCYNIRDFLMEAGAIIN
jgi:hypothetical protein